MNLPRGIIGETWIPAYESLNSICCLRSLTLVILSSFCFSASVLAIETTEALIAVLKLYLVKVNVILYECIYLERERESMKFFYPNGLLFLLFSI